MRAGRLQNCAERHRLRPCLGQHIHHGVRDRVLRSQGGAARPPELALLSWRAGNGGQRAQLCRQVHVDECAAFGLV
ncbi:hypothetical protein D3C85_1364410 [compost metagenome]